jgi:hypothetical protein
MWSDGARRKIAWAAVALVTSWAAPAEAQPPEGIGPFEIDAGDAGVLRPGFGGQLLGALSQGDGFSLVERRLRFRLDFASKGEEGLVGRVQVNAAPGALELIDMWAGWRFSEALGLRAGQFTVPMTRYRSGSFSTRLLNDWAPTTRAFGGERQRGLELYGEALGGLEYRLGVFEGTNARASHALGAALLYGQAPANPSRLVSPDARPRLHPEVVARVGWSSAPMELGGWADREGGPARLYVALSGAWDTNPEARTEWEGRVAIESMLKVSGFGAGLVGYASTLETTSGARTLGAVGALAGASYHLSTGTTFSGRFALVRVGAGAVEDASAVVADPLRGEREWGLGVRQDLLGDDLQLGTEVLVVEEDFGAGTQRDVVGRLLLQLVL